MMKMVVLLANAEKGPFVLLDLALLNVVMVLLRTYTPAALLVIAILAHSFCV
jgi:hypothetical protein